jgi:hypothetical protein
VSDDAPWTAILCRGSPGAGDVADILIARGAAVRWCGPDCPCGSDDDEDGPVSVFDDGVLDLDGTPADEPRGSTPATEARGGEAVDWDAVRPGEPLPGQEEDGA